MKKSIAILFIVLSTGFAASAQSTAFTYQGSLKDGPNAVFTATRTFREIPDDFQKTCLSAKAYRPNKAENDHIRSTGFRTQT